MKVGTDGVLLGAWATITSGNVLDIGTGTGLIAMMVAQRNKKTIIDAIELEEDAFIEAQKNIKNCDWAAKIDVHNGAIQAYQTAKKYDTIVSNPPFFINATKAPRADRNLARHTDKLSFDDLIDAVIRLLKPTGIFSLILPTTEAGQFIDLAKKKGLLLDRKCAVKPTPNKPAKRILMAFSFTAKAVVQEKITIETEIRHQYTKEYISLTKDFYLKF